MTASSKKNMQNKYNQNNIMPINKINYHSMVKPLMEITIKNMTLRQIDPKLPAKDYIKRVQPNLRGNLATKM